MKSRYCPRCGISRQKDWRFCPQCSHDFSGDAGAIETAGKGGGRSGRPSPVTGILVFAVLVLAGVGAWLRILEPATRSGPPGSPTPPPGAGAGELPEGHPPLEQLQLPEDVKAFIANLVTEAEKKPKDVAAWSRLSQVQYRAAQLDSTYYPAALESFRHVLELDPKNEEALRGAANVQYDLGNYRDALPYFEKYVARHPDDPGAQTDLATVRMNLGEIEPAIAAYRKVVAANPGFVQAHYNLGVALHQTGDNAGALAAFQRARDAATDTRIRSRVEQVIAGLEGRPFESDRKPEPQSPAGSTARATGATGSPFQRAIEDFFRSHEIVGPRVVGVEWSGPTRARVLVRDFPMAAMPPFARSKFTGRIREAVAGAKQAHGAQGTVEIAIVDAPTGDTMETVVE